MVRMKSEVKGPLLDHVLVLLVVVALSSCSSAPLKEIGEDWKEAGHKANTLLDDMQKDGGFVHAWTNAGTSVKNAADRTQIVMDQLSEKDGLLPVWKEVGTNVNKTLDEATKAIYKMSDATSEFGRSLENHREQLRALSDTSQELQAHYMEGYKEIQEASTKSMDRYVEGVQSVATSYTQSMDRVLSLQTNLIHITCAIIGLLVGAFAGALGGYELKRIRARKKEEEKTKSTAKGAHAGVPGT